MPIFPLPNCVVLPGAPQCLHIFEPRYRAMVVDELSRPSGEQYIAMAYLRPGYETHYCTHQAPIHPVLCLGAILKHQQLQDGRFNVLLLGHARVTISREYSDRSYRRGKLQPCQTINDLTSTEESQLLSQLRHCLSRLPGGIRKSALEILGKAADLECTADYLAFHLLSREALPGKQMILAEPRVDLRVKMLITLLERQHYRTTETVTACRTWPPSLSRN